MKILKKYDKNYPRRLMDIKDPPEVLYVEGDDELLNKNIIAIVGTRKPTEYGRKVAKEFATKLSENNICVVSGLAEGIDTYAHLGAKNKKGKTIAVLGCGFHHVYPKQNINLYNEILEEGGCVISEYHPDEKPKSENFPIRNRIISGLSMGVLIVEARYRSGSAITARYAKSQGKKVYCIPRNLDSKNSSGINEILRDGAKLITTPKELISDLYKEQNNLEEYNKRQIPEKYEQIYKLIENNLSKDELSIQLDIDIESLNSLLTMMEIEGIIKQIPGGRYTKT